MKDDGTLNDRKLREEARRLGAAAAGRLDADRVADAVVRRLREAPPARTGTWIRTGWLRIAAAVVILAGGGMAMRQVLQNDPPQLAAGGEYFVSDDLSDLSAEELRELLTVLDDTSPFGAPVTAGDNDLTELDAQQLREVLRTLEG